MGVCLHNSGYMILSCHILLQCALVSAQGWWGWMGNISLDCWGLDGICICKQGKLHHLNCNEQCKAHYDPIGNDVGWSDWIVSQLEGCAHFTLPSHLSLDKMCQIIKQIYSSHFKVSRKSLQFYSPSIWQNYFNISWKMIINCWNLF